MTCGDASLLVGAEFKVLSDTSIRQRRKFKSAGQGRPSAESAGFGLAVVCTAGATGAAVTPAAFDSEAGPVSAKHADRIQSGNLQRTLTAIDRAENRVPTPEFSPCPARQFGACPAFPANTKVRCFHCGGVPLSGSTTTVRRSSNQELRGFRSFMWMSMLMSLGVVFFGMQLMMVGPLKGRLEGIQARLDSSEGNMKKLVSARDGVWKTNDLLTSLQQQSGQLASLKKSVADIQSLRSTIQKEAEAANIALAALDRMSAVQQRILNGQQQTLQAATQLTAIEEVQKSIIHGSDATEVASNSLEGLVALQNRLIAASNGYEQASEGVSNLTDLTQKMAAQSDELKVAVQTFDAFIGLTNAVQTAAVDLETARASVAGMGSLTSDVLAASANLQSVQDNVRTLVALNDSLGGKTLQLAEARQNLESLLTIQNSLSEQSSQVADAIQNLEIMDDFRTEVAAHVKSLDTLRRTLMDIAMMESTLGRVAQVVEPLTQIGNLRRLGEEEVREAARVILDRRMTRFSQSEVAPDVGGAVSDSTDSLSEHAAEKNLVPLPPEARN